MTSTLHCNEGMPVKLTRSQRRRLTRLTNEVDRLIEADRRFFERRPDRSYRVRRAFHPEIEVDALLKGRATARPRNGSAVFTLVQQIEPGVRFRFLTRGPADAEPDLYGEVECRELYESLALSIPKLREIDHAFVVASEKGGGR